MQCNHSSHKRWILFGATFLVLIMGLLGCDNIGTPSNSTNSDGHSGGLWSPPPGFEVQPGQPVPQLNDNYWEELGGSHTNPWRGLQSVSAEIDEDGGTVSLGFHRYIIPEDAIDEERFFTLAYASIGGVAVDCGPSPYYFERDVTLILSYRHTNYDGGDLDPSNLHIWYISPEGDYEQLPSTVDERARTVSAEVDHFSRYIIG